MKAKSELIVEIYLTNMNDWRWRLSLPDRPVAISPTSYKTRELAKKDVQVFMRLTKQDQ